MCETIKIYQTTDKNLHKNISKSYYEGIENEIQNKFPTEFHSYLIGAYSFKTLLLKIKAQIEKDNIQTNQINPQTKSLIEKIEYLLKYKYIINK